MKTEYRGGSASVYDGSGGFNQLPGTFGDRRTGVDLAQLFLATTYA